MEEGARGGRGPGGVVSKGRLLRRGRLGHWVDGKVDLHREKGT